MKIGGGGRWRGIVGDLHIFIDTSAALITSWLLGRYLGHLSRCQDFLYYNREFKSPITLGAMFTNPGWTATGYCTTLCEVLLANI
jgi:hypothetical protein